MVSFVESWGAALEGREGEGAAARERVVKLARSRGCYQNARNIRLHEGLCTVAAGEWIRGSDRRRVIDGVPGP